MVRRVPAPAAALVCSVIGLHCTNRPVSSQPPTTKALVEVPLAHGAITKVDLLLSIDNSSSMGDKQALLKEAVPDLLGGLLNPRCVDAEDESKIVGRSAEGRCAHGKPEFEPIRDLHVAVVTSSLAFGPGACADRDQKAHLLGGVLDWTLDGAKSQEDLAKEVQAQVIAAGETGCGYEAQNESWYRFLVENDPYETIEAQGDDAALVGTDRALLEQRAAFLRPDSLVAVVQISDENESSPDPSSLGGRGWRLADPSLGAPRPTRACAASPASAECSSCGFVSNMGLPECSPPRFAPGSAEDPIDLRFFHMKRRFGVDPMHPLARYVDGLRNLRVPSRDRKSTCQNPLFAGRLPSRPGEDLCNLPRGSRTSNMVFFAAITGVPHDLLHFDPTDEQKSKLSADDWRKILGRDPLRYDFDGADPRMLESIGARGAMGDWDTRGKSLQYACTFDLETPRACPGTEGSTCDCDQDPSAPVCDRTNPKLQRQARAFPGVRHLALAKELGTQGIVSSVCPLPTRDRSPDNLRYGYRPAMKVILDTLRGALAAQCLPRAPKVDEAGRAPCVVFEVLPAGTGGCALDKGLERPQPELERSFRDEQAQAGRDVTGSEVCVLRQLDRRAGVACKSRDEAGWCYADGDEALRATRQRCREALVFSRAGNPGPGVTTIMRCLERAD